MIFSPISIVRGMNVSTKTGLIVAISSLVGYMFYPRMLDFGLKTQLRLSQDGWVFNLWRDPPFMTTSSMYLFEVMNPREALGGKKIRVKRRGPYVFDVANLKENYRFSDDNEQVTLEAVRKFYYRPDKSSDIDEKFYMLNPLVPTTVHIVMQIMNDRLPYLKTFNPLVLRAVNLVLISYGERLFYYSTARKLIFGYKLDLLEDVVTLSKRLGLETILPRHPADYIFGVGKYQNETREELTVYTGQGGTSDRFGEIAKWRGQDRVKLWDNSCGKINGSNGELSKPFVRDDKPIRIFISQACRSFHLYPLGKTKASLGMEALEFELSKEVFQGYRSNPGNRCFCADMGAPECRYDGLINLGPCLFNAPVFASRTNFKYVDSILKDKVDGMSGDEPPNSASFMVDPVSGQIVGANIALMGLIKVKRDIMIGDLRRVQNLAFVPFFVTHENIVIPNMLLLPLAVMQKMTNNYGTVFFISGAVGIAMVAYGMREASRQTKDIDIDDDDSDDDDDGGGDDDDDSGLGDTNKDTNQTKETPPPSAIIKPAETKEEPSASSQLPSIKGKISE